ncbi:MAG: DUF1284 domain-containing protein [Bacillota bacterium]
MIKLRGHHLICLQFFRGEGYSREFVENLENVIGRAERGEEIELVEGPDDVCRTCASLHDGRCTSEPAGGEAKIRPLDSKAADRLGVGIGERVFWREITARVSATPKGWLAAFCEGCRWEDACLEGKKKLGVL